MDKLWAPWRLKYIKATKKKHGGCFFCQSLKSGKKNYVFIKNKFSFAILNLFPYNNGHVMVSPRRHIGNLNKLNNQEVNDIFKTLKEAMQLLDKVLKPQGYNLGINIGSCGGAGIPGHLHLHVVPRWQSDTNFMPVISDSKIISQSLDELYKQLKANVKSKSN